MITQTSLQAYQEIKESKKDIMYHIICNLLIIYNNLTDTEICSFFNEKGLTMKPRARRNELVKLGVVYSSGKRECSVTNHVVHTWKLNKKQYWRCVIY